MDIIFFILRISFIVFSIFRHNLHQKNPKINKFYIMQYILSFIIKFDIILLHFDLNLIQRIMNSRFFQNKYLSFYKYFYSGSFKRKRAKSSNTILSSSSFE